MDVKNILYSVITQLIIWLGILREKLFSEWASKDWGKDWIVRRDRTFSASNKEAVECCDCGLTHVTLPLKGETEKSPAFRIVPIRPKSYGYKCRSGSPPPSPYVDESHLGDKL